MHGKLKIYASSDLLAGHSWLVIVIQSISAILLGSFFLIFHLAILPFFAIALGIMLISCGIQQLLLFLAFLPHRLQFGRLLYMLLVSTVGVILLLNPIIGGLKLLWLLGVWLLLHGIELLVSAIRTRTFSRGFRRLAGTNGLLSVLCAVVIFFSPLAGIQILDYLFAFYLIFYGIISLVVGVRLREIAALRRKNKETTEI